MKRKLLFQLMAVSMMLIAFTYSGNAQTRTCTLSENFETAENLAYAGTTITLPSGQWFIAGYVANSTTDHYNGTRAVRLRGNTNDANQINQITMLFDKPNGIGNLSFAYASFSSHSGGTLNIFYSTDQGTNWIPAGTLANIPAWSGAMLQASFDINVSGSVRIKIEKVTTTGSTSVNVDDICITDFTSTTTVSTPVFSPGQGNYTSAQNVTIFCTTDSSVIRYTLDGSDPTVSSTIFTTPIQVTSTTTIKAKAWRDGYTSSSVNTATYTFPVEVPNIAAFLAANSSTNPTLYKITGDVVFVFRNGTNMYVQDATGGLLIYDSSTPVITTAYDEGDVISGGIVGSYTLYNGLVEMIPALNTAASTSNIGPIIPVEVTVADIENNYAMYESKLVKILNTVFPASAFTTSSATNITIYQNSDSIVCRNVFKTLDRSFTAGYNANVTGFVLRFSESYQIAPRSNSDISDYVPPVPDPVLTINTPSEGEIFLTTSHFNADITIQNFILGTDGLLKLESPFLTGLGVPNPYYIDSDIVFNYLSALDITLPAGNYSITVSLTGLDSNALTPPVSVTRNFSFINPTVEAPVFTPAAGTYYETQQVTITSPTDSVTIYYTTDGTMPTTASILYSGAISVVNDMTIKAIAVRSGWNDSPVSEAAYIIVYDPVLVVTPASLDFTDMDSVKTFTVSGYYLTAPINISCDNSNFTIAPTTLPASSLSAIVTVTFIGESATTGILTVTSDTVSKTVTLNATIVPLPDPVLTVTPTSLSFTDIDSVKTFTVSGSYLTAPITIACNNQNFTVTPTTLPDSADSEIVTVTFTGDSATTGIITVTSDTVTKTIALTATIAPEPAIDTLIYQTGFEASEGFAATTVYNNTSVILTGPDNEKWGTYYGTPSTTSPLVGNQSMQMRWYTTAINNLGYTFTNFDLRNVTKVFFKAANTYNLKVTVSYSIDGGSTFMGDSIFSPDSIAKTFQYIVSETGEYDNVRLKFKLTLPESNPPTTARLYIDSVVVYGVEGVIPSTVATPVITPDQGYYYNPQNITISCATDSAVIRYTLDGSEPTESSTLYSAPFNITSTTTVKAKAWKNGLTPSFTAIAIYQFPTEVADIAAFKAANTQTNPTIYKITGDVTFIFRAGRYIHVQDNSGALLIYDNTTPVITNTYSEGDVISGGIYGTYTLYNGLVEMVPTLNPNNATSNTGQIIPVDVTISELITNYHTYESKLVKISDGIFEGGTFTTASATSIPFSQAGNDMECRNIFKTLDMVIPQNFNADVTGFPSIYNGVMQIAPRANNDITGLQTLQVPTPYFSPAGGLYYVSTSMNVAILCDSADATIYYTTDGTDPDANATQYTDSVLLNLGLTTIKAIAYKEGMLPSEIASATYEITIGINENSSENIMIYPNPTNSVITIDLGTMKASRIELLSINGQLLYSDLANSNLVTLNLSNYSKGFYLIRILTEEGIIVRKITRM